MWTAASGVPIEEMLQKHSKIVILGFPGSGKTFLADSLEINPAFFDFEFVRTDDYIADTPAEIQLLKLINVLGNLQKWVAEGCLCFRLLRKIEELNLSLVRPTCIVYAKSGVIESRHINFCKGLDKIWGDFTELASRNKTKYEYLEWG